MDLFQHRSKKERRGEPLAERLRPLTLEEFAGQAHLVGEGQLLERTIQNDAIPSLIFWGPPGSGKTTLARIIAKKTQARFFPMSAVSAGIKEIREVVEKAIGDRDYYGRKTILFIDEIHRFNKAQQDALLPYVENGTVTLIGATTENPSFEVISALLSRSRVLRLEPLSPDDLVMILTRAMQQDHVLKQMGIQVDGSLLALIAQAAHGDARRALTTLEVAASLISPGQSLTEEIVSQALQQKTLLYDKNGEEHYNVISAFIKSMRGSDPDAAVYYMARMLEAGEDPLFIIRRMVIFAAEDVGNADPQALSLAIAAKSAVEFVGLPEAVLPMTQAVTYLACAPKSNSALLAYSRARKDVREHGPLAVPLHIRNAPTQIMKDFGYGREYRYPHDFEGHYVVEHYLPEALADRIYYEPSPNGHEQMFRTRLQDWRQAGDKNRS